MPRVGVERRRAGDVDEQWTPFTAALGQSRIQILLGIRRPLSRAVPNPDDQNAVIAQRNSGRRGLAHQSAER